MTFLEEEEEGEEEERERDENEEFLFITMNFLLKALHFGKNN